MLDINIEKNIALNIDLNSIKVSIDTPYTQKEDGSIIVEISNGQGVFKHTDLYDITKLIKNDIKHFEKLNEHNDERHQIHIDTLCVYGLKITDNHIRVQYWFDQFLDDSCHRTCSGVVARFNKWNCAKKDGVLFVLPDVYSPDVCVYW